MSQPMPLPVPDWAAPTPDWPGTPGWRSPSAWPPPVAPPVAVAAAVLNAYAQSCFAGDYQACDDLYHESPPLSDYEEYGGTCGGRVKVMTVMACTDLD